jgi:hypothetical protein
MNQAIICGETIVSSGMINALHALAYRFPANSQFFFFLAAYRFGRLRLEWAEIV